MNKIIYESKFEETSFANHNVIKAIQLTNRILSKRLGIKIFSSYLPVDYINKEGKFSGIYCLLPNYKKMRYNWKMGKNSEIVSIDFWTKKKKGIVPPDYNLPCEGINVVQLISAIAEVLKGNIEPEYQIIQESIKNIVKEDFTPKTMGQKSAGITKALKQWALDMDITDEKLQNTRIKYLWKDYVYWFNEIADETIPEISEGSFRNYLLDFMKVQGIENIYIRTLKIRKGNKEKLIITDDSSEAAYKNIEHLKMNISDLREFMATSLRAVARGYRYSMIICGKAGFGKSSITVEILKQEGMKVISVQQIRNVKVLYNLLSKYNTPKDVLLFDDTPDVFDKKFSGYLSAALDDKPERIISFPSEIGKDMTDFKKFNSDLKYKGKIVVLTNRRKNELPSYLRSRAIAIEVQADVEEMSDDIRKNLLNVLPNVDVKVKIEVLDFIEQIGKFIESIDYRTFQLCVVFRLSNSPEWKKQCYALLK